MGSTSYVLAVSPAEVSAVIAIDVGPEGEIDRIQSAAKRGAHLGHAQWVARWGAKAGECSGGAGKEQANEGEEYSAKGNRGDGSYREGLSSTWVFHNAGLSEVYGGRMALWG